VLGALLLDRNWQPLPAAAEHFGLATSAQQRATPQVVRRDLPRVEQLRRRAHLLRVARQQGERQRGALCLLALG